MTRLRAPWPGRLLGVAAAGFLLTIPLLFSTVDVTVAIAALVAATVAISFNLLYGYAGMLSFGLAGFYGIGAYATALISQHAELSFLPSALLASLLVALVGLLSGVLLVGLPPTAFIMLTFVLADLLLFGCRQLSDLTGGDTGLILIVPDELNIASNASNVYYLTLAIGGLAFLISVLVVRSRAGTVLAAIRENPERVATVGISVWRYRLFAYVVSAWIAGVAGALGALQSQLVFPSVFDWHVSADALINTLLGGVGTLIGPVVGAGVMYTINYFVGRETTEVVIVNGAILLVVILIAPRGLVPFVQDAIGRRRSATASRLSRRRSARSEGSG